MIEARQLVKRAGGQTILEGVSFRVEAGEIVGIIGPNGAGKSTLLGLLSGVERPDGGDALLRGRSVSAYGRRELARLMAVLQQGGLPETAFTVREVVEMGRFPYQNWLGDEEADSLEVIEQALAAMRLTALAAAEPTTYLDIGYQMQLLDTVRAWQRRDGLTVVAVLHDLNLAAQYCDRLLVLHQGRVAASGRPEQVLTPALLREVYDADADVLQHPQTGRPQVLLNPRTGEAFEPAHKALDTDGEQARGGTTKR
ncbi:heme ABC transporter ATP-binding protein [Paenibacillus sp. 598K]|uniref:ABC transporter ATP-binding protein n=1 Tax=Paenibacillus sp. 598K TaxID=1117987 RepID=UPI000FF90963|nr:ABC transporter ATP-binding protein [Paenibacillus sp. 598K]GBF78404.1 heme ABC transporter ATP-binding protein [Paenibacillus sp. 598K]